MAVIWAKEIWDERGGEEGEKFVRERTRAWRVYTDNVHDTDVLILATADIPRLYTPYITATGTDYGCLVKKRTAKQDQDHPNFWKVTVNYSSQFEQIDEQENPLDRPAKISYRHSEVLKPLERDLNNVLIRNSAQQRFDPPLEDAAAIGVLVITKNMATYNDEVALAYHNAVNSDVFFGKPPGTVKCKGIDGESAYENQISYWVVTFSFEIDREGWDPPILDQGYYTVRMKKDANDQDTTEPELDDKGRLQYLPILDKHNGHVTSPELLDGHGRRLPKDAQPVYLQFERKKKLPFAPLGLP